MTLTLESRYQEHAGTLAAHQGQPTVMITPALSPDYWSYRVRLTDEQSVIGFPKFGTIGIGFAVEAEDWNTNLPYTCDANKIAAHIAENRGDSTIRDEDILWAIRSIQEAATADKTAGRW